MQSSDALEFRLLSPEWELPLAAFFEALERDGDSHFFHPHPFTASEAKKRCAYTGKDLYYIAVSGSKVVGYGMLRGWDEGYDIPSVGVAIHPEARGLKLGTAMMHFFHSAARMRGANRIRLKVYKDNTVAKKLWEGLGYVYREEQERQLIGFLDL